MTQLHQERAKLSAQAPAVDMRPEVELLLCCARTYIDTERAERIADLLQKDIDWEYLIQITRSHRVMPLLYKSLNTTCPEAVPKPTLAQLKEDFHSLAQHNLFLTAKLLKLLALFETQEILVIPYKGPILAASAYGNLVLRQFCDLDILVHPQDIPRSKELLLSQGYQLQEEHPWEYHFGQEDTGVNVDLHQAIAPSHFNLSLDFEGLWSRQEPLAVAGATVNMFLPEDMLLILCVQWCSDCCIMRERLAQLCDIAELLRAHQEMNWFGVMEQASKLGIERMLLLSLLLVNDFLGTELPTPVWQRIHADTTINSLAMPVRKWLFSEGDEPKLLGQIEGVAFWIGIRERLPDRVRHFFALMQGSGWMTPNERDEEFLPLPPSLSFLYYLVRPLRVFSKYGLSPLKRLL